jgi:hypothetical protein
MSRKFLFVLRKKSLPLALAGFGSVTRASPCGLKGPGFNSRQGQPVNDSLSSLMFLSLSLSPSSFLFEINKNIFLKKKEESTSQLYIEGIYSVKVAKL